LREYKATHRKRNKFGDDLLLIYYIKNKTALKNKHRTYQFTNTDKL